VHCFSQVRYLLSCIDLLEQFPEDRLCWICEALELIAIAILVSAADGEPEPVRRYRDVPTPVFRNNFFSLKAALSLKFLRRAGENSR